MCRRKRMCVAFCTCVSGNSEQNKNITWAQFQHLISMHSFWIWLGQSSSDSFATHFGVRIGCDSFSMLNPNERVLQQHSIDTQSKLSNVANSFHLFKQFMMCTI